MVCGNDQKSFFLPVQRSLNFCNKSIFLYLNFADLKDPYFAENMIKNQKIRDRDFSGELHFTASRSSGPGGQNVNKVNTRVELRFDVSASSLLTEEEKTVLLEKLSGRVNAEGFLILYSQAERSQIQNKARVIERFYELIEKALIQKKVRKPTEPTSGSKEERLEEKRKQSEKKKRRKSI